MKHLWGAVAVMTCWGCGPSPQPIPPPDIAFGELAISDAGDGRVRIEGLATGSSDAVDVIQLRQAQDAIPTLASLPLDTEGRFTGEIDGTLGDLFRLQARSEDERSPVYDVTAADGVVASVDTPLPCLLAEPELVLDPVDVGSLASGVLTFDNQCGDILGLDETALAVTLQWEADPVSGQTLGDVVPGGQLDLAIRHNRDTPGRDLNALVARIFDASPTSPALRLITLRSEHR